MYLESNSYLLLFHLGLSLSCDKMKSCDILKRNKYLIYKNIMITYYDIYMKTHDFNYFINKFMIITFFNLTEKKYLKKINSSYIFDELLIFQIIICDPDSFLTFLFLIQFSSFFKSISKKKYNYFVEISGKIVAITMISYFFVNNFKNSPYSFYI